MSYRRRSEQAAESRRYKVFCQDNINLMEQIALPSFVTESHDTFIYLVMHGGLPSDAPVRFNIEDLDEEKRRAYLLLLSNYFAAGLSDPGLGGLSKAETDEVERKHPRQPTR